MPDNLTGWAARAYRAERVVTVDYTNWKGERSTRRIQPIRMLWGSNKWHTEPQWLLVAIDLDKGDERVFAMSGFHGWGLS